MRPVQPASPVTVHCATIRAIPARALLIAAGALVLPLAACNSGPSVDVKDAKPSEVQEKVAAATGTGGGFMIQPGRWEGTMTMHDMEMPNVPNLPPQVKEQMKARMGAARGFISCVTPEDVKDQKAFYNGADKSCKYDHFTLSGGKIDAAMNCDRGEQGKTAMTMKGTYSPDAYRMDMDSRSEGVGPMGAMTIKMSIAARRVGACRGTKDEL